MFQVIKIVAFILVLVGAINWGLVGLFDFDLVARIFGEMTKLTRVIYILVGFSAIITALTAGSCYVNINKDKL